jgi:hypothetical protein
MRIACVGRYAHGLILAGLAAAAITLAPQPGQAAPLVVLHEGYDSTFGNRCGGSSCKQAVAELRAGNYNTSGDWELGIGPTTGTENVDQGDYVWDGAPQGFQLTYEGTDLKLTVGDNELLYAGADLSTTNTLYIRARGHDGNETQLINLALDGSSLGELNALNPDYLSVTNFDWGSDWTLTGDILLPLHGSGSSPAAQFKLTNLGDTVDTTGISEPATLAIIGAGLLGAGLLRRRRSR